VEIENKLKEMGFELPNPPLPAANYIGCVRVGNLLFVGGNIGRINGELRYSGKVGDKVTLEQAYEAARNCALNHLAIIKAAIGDLDKVERIVKVLGYVNVAPGRSSMASRICWFGYGAGGASMPARRWVLPLSAEKRLSRPKSSFRFASKPGFLPKRARRNRDRAVLNWVRPHRASQSSDPSR